MNIVSRFPSDTRKAVRATKLIGFGAPGSSTADYVRQAGPLANCGAYSAGDIVFVSINGRRRNRVGIEAYDAELTLAMVGVALRSRQDLDVAICSMNADPLPVLNEARSVLDADDSW